MCFNISLVKTAQQIAAFYGINISEIPPLPPEYYNVSGFSHPQIPVMIRSETGNVIRIMKWGLIPSWIKNSDDARSIANKTLNARSETLSELSSFKSSYRTKRCIIIADGFFEPHHAAWGAMKGKDKSYPFYIRRKDREIISLAGLYAEWQNRETENREYTFTIITTPANALLEKIHNSKKRMPVLLPDKAQKLEEWLDPALPVERIGDFFKPFNIDYLEAYPVSKIIYARKESNTPLAIKPFSYPELVDF